MPTDISLQPGHAAPGAAGRRQTARRVISSLLLALAALPAAAQQPAAPATPAAPPRKLDPFVTTAARAPQPPEQVAFSVTTFDAETLRLAPAVTLDGALRSVPGFSLFRRSDSLSAHPTAQGASLRGLGPSGASRSLVVLDGIPLNDPFGGWVAWTKVPREGLARAELVPGGGATAWGNAALGGVVQLLSLPDTTAGFRASALAGDRRTRSFEFAGTVPASRATLQLSGRIFATDGFPLVAEENRGPVDQSAFNRHRWLQGRVRVPLSEGLEAGVSARTFYEFRNNGTGYQQNSSREDFVSAFLSGRPGGAFTWDATVYVQDQNFDSTFGAVNATRTVETPASNQHDVPAEAFGAAWTGVWQHADGARTTAGADWRTVEGETQELATYNATLGDFTRARAAGGSQYVAGVFALHDRPLGRNLRAILGARLDWWKDYDGHRIETDLPADAIVRADSFADRDGTEFSPSAGLVWSPDAALRLRANVQHAFRRPTLNELYRPFRVGPNVTEANEALRTERVTSTEIGAEWRVPGAGGAPSQVTLGVTGFWNELRDAVGNVTLFHGPGTFPIVGFIPAGGVGRQRLNLDRTRVQGIELSASWHPTTDLTFTVDYLFNDAKVRRASVEPALVGRRLAQVPEVSGSVSALWRAPWGFTVMPRVRWLGEQFEDDENQLVLDDATVVDLAISRPIHRNVDLFVNVENLGNARIETGRTAGGLVNTGAPRMVLAGFRGTW